MIFPIFLMWPLVFGIFGISLEPVVDILSRNTKQVAEELREFGATTHEYVRGVGERVASTTALVKEFSEETSGLLQKQAGDFRGQVERFGDGVAETVGTTKEVFASLSERMVVGARDQVGEAQDRIAPVVSRVREIPGEVAAALQAPVEEAGGHVASIAEQVSASVRAIPAKAADVVGAGVVTLNDRVGRAVERTTDTLGEFGEAAVRGARRQAFQVGDRTADFAEQTADTLVGIREKAAASLKNSARVAEDQLQQTGDAFVDRVDETRVAASVVGEKARDRVARTTETVGREFAGVIGGTQEAVGQVAREAVEQARERYVAQVSGVQDAVGGFFNRIISGGDTPARRVDGQAIRDKNRGIPPPVRETELPVVVRGQLRGTEIDIGAGSITAGNILYNLAGGDGITISGDLQRPTISSAFWQLDGGIITTIDPEIPLTVSSRLTVGTSLLSELQFAGPAAVSFSSTADISYASSSITRYAAESLVVHEATSTVVIPDLAGDIWRIATSATGTPIVSVSSEEGGRVGIGTATPSAKLSIYSSATSSVAEGGTASATQLFNIATAEQENIFVADSAGRIGFGTSTSATYFVVVNGSSSFLGPLYASSSAYFALEGGRVGIGTDDPSETLSVRGTLGVSEDATFEVPPFVAIAGCNALETDGGGQIVCGTDERGSSGGRGTVIGKGGSNTVAYWAGNDKIAGNSIFVWDNISTRLGVGTSTPDARLNVYGTSTVLSLQSSTNSTSAFEILNESTSTVLVFDTSNTRLGIGTATPATTTSVAGDVYLTGGLGVGIATSVPGVIETTGVINVGGSGTSTFANGIVLSEGCFIDSSGSCVSGSADALLGGSDGQIQYNNGGTAFGGASNLVYDDTNNRVGIGTSTPGTLLSVAAGDVLFSGVNLIYASSSTSTIPNDVENAFTFATSTTATSTFSLFTISTASTTPSGSGAVGIGTSTLGSTAKFVVGGDTYIDGGLGVGIATTTNGIIHTSGELYIRGSATSTFANGIKLDDGCFLLADGNCAASATAGAQASGWTDDGAIVRLGTAADQVSIGNATPISPAVLSVYATSSTASAGIFRAAASQSANVFEVQDSSGNILVAVNSDGNFGIGTSSPNSSFTTTGVPSTAHTFSTWAINTGGASATTSSLVVNPASAASDTNLLGLLVADGVKFLVDAEGDVYANTLTTVGSVTSGSSTFASLLVENSFYVGDAIGDLFSINSGDIFYNFRATSTIIDNTVNAWSIATTSDGIPLLTIDTLNDRIGVATTAPSATLSIEQQNNAPVFFIGDEGTSTPHLFVAGDGNVGVATSAPAQDFSVGGNIYITGGLGIGVATTTANNVEVAGDVQVTGDLSVTGAFAASSSALTVNATTTISNQLLITEVPTTPHSFAAWAIDTVAANATSSSLVINPASAAADTNLLGILVNGNVKFLVDAEGDIYANSLTTEGSVVSGSTTVSSQLVESALYIGDAIGDLLSINAGNIFYNFRSTSTIPSDTLNAFSFATSSTAVPLFTFDTLNYRVGLGTTAPATTFSVGGAGNVYAIGGLGVGVATTSAGVLQTSDVIVVGGSGTSTFTNGISLIDGCFLTADGTCAASGGTTINSGTANRLAYYSAASTVDDVSYLVTDTSNNRLGIGSTTPGVTLSVNGAAIFTEAVTGLNFTATSTAASSTLVDLDFTDAAGTSLSLSGGLTVLGSSTLAATGITGNFFVGDAAGDDFTINVNQLNFTNQSTSTIPNDTENAFSYATTTGATSTFSLLTISTASTTPSGTGAVGIGTSTLGSTAKFVVGGDTYIDGGLGIGIATTTDGVIQTSSVIVVGGTGSSTFANGIQLSAGCFRDSAGNCVGDSGNLVGGSDGQVQYNNGGAAFGGASNLTYDDTNNRVGIGSSSPGTILGVNGDTVIAGTTTARTFYATSTSASSTLQDFAFTDAQGTSVSLSGGLYAGGAVSFASTLDVTGSTTLTNAGITGNFFVGDAAGDDFTINVNQLNFTNQSTSTIPNDTENAFSYATTTGATSTFSLLTISTASTTPSGTGAVGIGTSTLGSTAKFVVGGDTYIDGGLGIGIATTTDGVIQTSSVIVVGGTGSSTFANGINLTDGCFAIGGTCLAAGGGSGTVNSGTAGRLAFYSSTGTTVDDTDLLHWDDTNDLFGIGTTTPGARLSVSGDGNGVDSQILFSGIETVIYASSSTSTIPSAASYAWTIATSTTANPIFEITTVAAGTQGTKATTSIIGGFVLDGGAVTYDHATGTLSVDSLSTGPLSFDSDAGIVSWIDFPVSTTTRDIIMSYSAQLDSNPILTIHGVTDGAGGVGTTTVGIGTTTPAWLLHVSSSSPFFAITDDDAGVDLKHWTLSSQGGAFYIASTSDKYATSSIARLTITSNGLVGLGSSTPSQEFSVTGNIYATGGLGVGIATTTSGYIEATGDLALGGVYSVTGSGTSTITNNLQVQGTLQAGSGSIFLGNNFLNFNTSATSTISNSTINAFSIATSTTIVPTLTIDTSRGVAGHIGLGTTSPTAHFTISDGTYLHTFGSDTRPVQTDSYDLDGNGEGLFVSGKYAYVGRSGGSGDEIYIFDIADPRNIQLAGSIDPADNNQNPQALFVSGRYLYVGYDNGAGGELGVFDISDPSRPTELDHIDLGSGVEYEGLFVAGRYLYVGHGSTAGNDFHIYDVSDPSNLVEIGGADIGNNVTAVYVAGRYAYLGTNSGTENFQIYDISDPTAPTEVSTFDVSTTINSIYVSGGYAYVAMNTAAGNDLVIMDVTDPVTPIIAGGAAFGSNARAMDVAGRYAYVVTASDSGDEVIIYDIAATTSPRVVGGLEIGAATNNIAVSGKYFYITNNKADLEFRVYELPGIDAPAANIGTIVSNSINVSERLRAESGYFDTSLNVGERGIMTDGALGVHSTTTASFFGYRLGIGTTSPMAALSVVGNIALTGCAQAATSTSGALLNACVDVAETYPVSEEVTPGDIMQVGADGKLRKAGVGGSIIGVVSTEPGIVLEGSQAFFGGSRFSASSVYSQNSSAPIALVGRVPIRINLEGGEIKPGDRIALSSVAGIGTKATTSGVTIGIALEEFSDIENCGIENSLKTENCKLKIGKILVFVNLGYTKLDIDAGMASADLTTNGWSVDQRSGRVNVNFFGYVDMTGNEIINVSKILSQDGNWSINEDGHIVAKKVTTEELCVGSTCITEAELKALLKNAGMLEEEEENVAPSPSAPEPESDPVVVPELEPVVEVSEEIASSTPDEIIEPQPVAEEIASSTPEEIIELDPEPEPEPVVEGTASSTSATTTALNF